VRTTCNFVTRLASVAAVLFVGFALFAGPVSAQEVDYLQVPPTVPNDVPPDLGMVPPAPPATVLSGPSVGPASPPTGTLPVNGTEAVTLALVGAGALVLGSAFVLSSRRARLDAA
jgi:hypothetical protein